MPDSPFTADSPVVAEVVRSCVVESVHRGSVVVLAADGSVELSLGAPAAPMLPRSAKKPIQAVGMLYAGLDLEGELLALAAASHSAEPFHLEGARRILERAGLYETDLRTPPDWPLDERVKVDYLRAGGGPARIAMNCSGKHAAMLATCVGNDWETASYLDPKHPLQLAIAATVSELCGEPIAHTGVDGCGAPLRAVSLTGLARAFSAMAAAAPGTPERRVVEAIQSHPEWTSGTTREEARLIRAIPGLFGKIGAEGVFAVALDDGRSVALKIADGGMRAVYVVMSAVLQRFGLDAPVLDELSRPPLLGGGLPVGEIRPVLPTASLA